MLKRIWKRITGDYWTVKRCRYPFPEGYATYNRKRNMILDTGLSLEQAKATCAELNG